MRADRSKLSDPPLLTSFWFRWRVKPRHRNQNEVRSVGEHKKWVLKPHCGLSKTEGPEKLVPVNSMAQDDNCVCTQFLGAPGGKCHNASMPYRSGGGIKVTDYVVRVWADNRNRLEVHKCCLQRFPARLASSVADQNRVRSPLMTSDHRVAGSSPAGCKSSLGAYL